MTIEKTKAIVNKDIAAAILDATTIEELQKLKDIIRDPIKHGYTSKLSQQEKEDLLETIDMEVSVATMDEDPCDGLFILDNEFDF